MVQESFSRVCGRMIQSAECSCGDLGSVNPGFMSCALDRYSLPVNLVGMSDVWARKEKVVTVVLDEMAESYNLRGAWLSNV